MTDSQREALIARLRETSRQCRECSMHETADDFDAAIAALASVSAEPWQPIETAPEGVTVVVGWMAQEDANLCSDFDWLEDGIWQKHSEHYEWAYSVAPAGSHMPSESAPYTHWMPLPEIPTIQQAQEQS